MPQDLGALDSMRERHAFLESMIKAEYARAKPDDSALRYLKVQKLQLKEQMDALNRA